MNEKILTIFGGSGFIASELVYKLAEHFNEIRVLSRNVDKCNHLKVIKNVDIFLYDPSITNSYTVYLKDTDVVINTVGILNESRNVPFEEVHFNFVKTLVNKSRENLVSKFIHISALNADINGPSNYLKTKGKADDFISSCKDSRFKTIIFRPSIVFGEGDSFFNRFNKLLKFIPVFPLASPQSMFSPIYVKDLCDFIAESIFTKKYDNQINDVTGPSDYTFIALIKLILSINKKKRIIIPLNYTLSYLQAFIFTYFIPGKIFTLDNFKSLQIDNISSDSLKGHSSIEKIVPSYLTKKDNKLDIYRKNAGR